MRDEPVNDIPTEEENTLSGSNDEVANEPAPIETTPNETQSDTVPNESVESAETVIDAPSFSSADVSTDDAPEQVAPQSLDTPPMVTTPTVGPAPKKKGKKLLVIGGIVAVVLAVLVGGGALAYNFWYQNPNKVVSDAIVHALTAKTYSATGTFNLETDEYKMKLEMSGRTTQEANSTSAVKLTYETDGSQFTVDGEGVFSGEGDMYIKLNNARDLVKTIEDQSNGMMDFSIFDDVIELIDGNWVKIGKEDLGDLSEDLEKSQKCFADISKQLEQDTDFRKTVEKETKDLYAEHTFIIVGDKLGSRTINGQGSLGYTLTGNASKANQFFRNFGDTQLGKKLKECNKDINFEDIVIESEDADESEATEDTVVELWVSRFGHTITEVSIKGETDEGKGSLVVNPTFNENKPIEIPTDVVTFEELKTALEKAYTDYYTAQFESATAQNQTGSGLFN